MSFTFRGSLLGPRLNTSTTNNSSMDPCLPQLTRRANPPGFLGVGVGLHTPSLHKPCFSSLSLQLGESGWITTVSLVRNSKKSRSSAGTQYLVLSGIMSYSRTVLYRFFFLQKLGFAQRTKYYGVWLLAEVGYVPCYSRRLYK